MSKSIIHHCSLSSSNLGVSVSHYLFHQGTLLRLEPVGDTISESLHAHRAFFSPKGTYLFCIQDSWEQRPLFSIVCGCFSHHHQSCSTANENSLFSRWCCFNFIFLSRSSQDVFFFISEFRNSIRRCLGLCHSSSVLPGTQHTHSNLQSFSICNLFSAQGIFLLLLISPTKILLHASQVSWIQSLSPLPS